MDWNDAQAAKRQLGQLIDKARKVLVFTGAGISTESGIPDFRSPGGLWTKFQPIEFGDFVRSEEMRREAWRRKFAMEETFRKAEPNRGHRAVAKLVERGKVTHVVTQNVDGLHQVSGVPNDKVVELHGNSTYAKCLSCATRYELDAIRVAFEREGKLPHCTWCNGIVKTATISFGQAMPEDAMARAEAATRACDLMLSIGSSLVVYPAAGFPIMAKRSGARYAILNREPTDQDGLADLVLNLEIGPTLGDVVGVN